MVYLARMPNSAAEAALQRLRARLDVVEARDVATRSKINEVTICRWKGGQQAFNPTLHTLERLARGLQMSIAELVSIESAAEKAEREEREGRDVERKAREMLQRAAAMREPTVDGLGAAVQEHRDRRQER